MLFINPKLQGNELVVWQRCEAPGSLGIIQLKFKWLLLLSWFSSDDQIHSALRYLNHGSWEFLLFFLVLTRCYRWKL